MTDYSSLPFPQISLDVWEEKYKWGNEQTPEDTMRRVANALEVDPEPLVNFEFVPAGRILAGAGTDRKVTWLNCAVLPEIPDSMDGIADSVKGLMLWLKGAQGVGTDFSSLRPANTPLITNEGAIASGPLSFMQLWDTACRTIMSGGARRGALMGTMRCDHPDIEQFIIAKRTAGNLTQFNLSVLCTDKFMHAVKNDLLWELKFNGVHYKTISARALWELIMQNTYEFAEPGVIFIDTIQKNHRIPSEKIITTNPCQPAFASLLSPEKIIRMAEVKIGDEIWSAEGWTTVVNKIETGIKPVYKYTTNAGIFYGTEEHRVVSFGKKVKANKATHFDILPGPIAPDVYWNYQNIIDGLLLGDGTYHEASGKVYLCVGEKDQDYFTDARIASYFKTQCSWRDYYWEVQTGITKLDRTYDRIIPTKIFYGDAETKCAFLCGLYSANGSVVNNRIQLKATSRELIEQVQCMLSSLGMVSYITTNKATDVEFINGEYTCKQSYDLNISTDRWIFYDRIGFIQEYKNKKLKETLYNYKGSRQKLTYDIVLVEYLGEMPVYDITVDNNSHTYWTGGINVSNCGEIPLPAYGVCCLGAVNLLACIDEPFTDRSKVNFGKLDRAIIIGIQALNSVINKTPYACPEQEEVMKRTRRIGLGVMGLGSACNALGMSYVEGAKHLLDRFNELVQNNREQPITTTIAPTGNTGVFAKNVSGGIEPVFALEYTRSKREVDGSSKEYIVQDASQTLFNKVYALTSSEELLTQLRINKLMKANTAQQLSPTQHLEIQAYAQRFIDNSISKTINCPVDISYEDFKNIYMQAYELGCKGCTTYRPSAVRGEVLKVVEEKDSSSTQPKVVETAPATLSKQTHERSEILDSLTAKFFWPPHERAYYVTVGSMEDLPYECFINSKSVNSELVALARLISAQFRRGQKVADISFVWEELQQVGGNDEGAWVNGRYHKSLVAAIGNIIEKLADDIILEDDEEFEIKIQEEVEYERTKQEHTQHQLPQCPKCGQHSVISEAGCEKCLSCSWSKCS
jgi:ribonucleoside-diphosphate reductase alpha chain